MKQCARCNGTYPLDDFPLSKQTSTGRYAYCKPCKVVKMREYSQARKADGRMFDQNLARALKKYGVTKDWYRKRMARQCGLCDICGQEPSGGRGNRLHIDHDHITGFARGLICGECNNGLGLFKDSPQALRNAATYLERELTWRTV